MNVSLDKLYQSAVHHHSRGESAAAEEEYKAILAVDPHHDAAMHLLGVVAYQTGRFDEGISLIQNAIKLNSKVAIYFDNLGLVLQKKTRFDEAITAHEKAISLQPRLASAYSNRGLAQQSKGFNGDSIHSFRAALAIVPTFANAHFNLGNSLRALGRLDEAIASYRAAINSQPAYWEAHAYLGTVFKDLGDFENAINALNNAIRLRPDTAWLHLRLGNTFKECGRYDDAIGSYRAALNLKPAYIDCYNNLGSVLVDLGRFHEGEAAFQKAISYDGDSLAARYNLSLLFLRLGDYKAGWPLYEARSLIATQDGTMREYSQPRWTGQSLAGSTVFLYAEQGLGDTIQFSRFVDLLAVGAAQVILEVPKKMLKLFHGIKGVTHLIGSGEDIPPFDFHCPLMSLPGLLGITVDTIPSQPAYLAFDEERRLHWRKILGTKGFKIGVVWQGNPNSPSERGRSAPLAEFACLSNIRGVRLISLQKVDGLGQLGQLPANVKVEALGKDFDSGPNAFIDTAAVMMELDLIITVDTSIGHLAGALGRPTWLALQAVPHWVWMSNRSDTPWYPSFRLFRQRERGDWRHVFNSMGEALLREPLYLERSV